MYSVSPTIAQILTAALENDSLTIHPSNLMYSQTPIKRTPLGPRLGVRLIGVSA